MNYNLAWLAVVAVALALVSGVAGAQLFPKETIVEHTLVVPQEVIVTETIVETKEVFYEDTEKIDALGKELSLLIRRYEQQAGKSYDGARIARELSEIEHGIKTFSAEYKQLVLEGFTPSQVSFDQWYAQDVTIKQKKVTVNGVQREFDEVKVVAKTRVRYEDADTISFKRWSIEVTKYLDSNGVWQTSASASLI
jgi:hypothetical protein